MRSFDAQGRGPAIFAVIVAALYLGSYGYLRLTHAFVHYGGGSSHSVEPARIQSKPLAVAFSPLRYLEATAHTALSLTGLRRCSCGATCH